LIFDLLLTGGFIAIAVLLRHSSRNNCNSRSSYPNVGSYRLWTKNISDTTYLSQTHLRCNLDKAAFAIAIANSVFYLILAILSYRLFTVHRRELDYVPNKENLNSRSRLRNSSSRKKLNRFSHDTEATVDSGNHHSYGAYRAPPTAGDNGAAHYNTAHHDEAAHHHSAGRFDPRLDHPHGHYHQQPGTQF
jgi:hypothetical protein